MTKKHRPTIDKALATVRLLDAVASNEAISQRNLAEEARMSLTRAHFLLVELREAGYLACDPKTFRHSLTVEGKRYLAETRRNLLVELRGVVNHLSRIDLDGAGSRPDDLT